MSLRVTKKMSFFSCKSHSKPLRVSVFVDLLKERFFLKIDFECVLVRFARVSASMAELFIIYFHPHVSWSFIHYIIVIK